MSSNSNDNIHKEPEFCFICNCKTTTKSSSQSGTINRTQICDRFKNYLENFLKPDYKNPEVKSVEINGDCNKSDIYKTFICCDKCSVDVEIFCEMCENLESLQDEMIHVIVTISNLIGFKSNRKAESTVPNKDSLTCFICHCEPEEAMPKSALTSSQIETCLKFTIFINRYISNTKKPCFEKGILEKIGKLQNTLLFYCCDKCLPKVETICEMYEAIDSVQLEILRILHKISNKMSNSVNLNTQMVPKFWKHFPYFVEQKRCQHFPRVNLKRLPLPEAAVNPKVEPEYQDNDVDADTEAIDDLGESTGIPSHLPPENTEADEVSSKEKLGHDDAGDVRISTNMEKDFVTNFLKNLDFASLTFHKPSQAREKSKPKRAYRRWSINMGDCVFCPKTFKGRRGLKIHIHGHTTEKPFICRICLNEYSTKKGLRVHQGLTHYPEKLVAYTCETCGKSFHYQSNLAIHIKVVHLRLRRFECKFCEHRFSRKHRLENHQQSKHFWCAICQKIFLTRDILRSHRILVHAETPDSNEERIPKKFSRTRPLEKKFKCSIPGCDWSFSEKRYLRRHMIRHTGEKGFQCHECGKSFGLFHNLKTHQQIHKPVRPFICSHCGKGFNYEHRLTKHEIKYHSADANNSSLPSTEKA